MAKIIITLDFSEEVVLQLIKSKCISSLLYGLDACALTKSELSLLDFTVNRFFSPKFFQTGNIEVNRVPDYLAGVNLGCIHLCRMAGDPIFQVMSRSFETER